MSASRMFSSELHIWHALSSSTSIRTTRPKLTRRLPLAGDVGASGEASSVADTHRFLPEMLSVAAGSPDEHSITLAPSLEVLAG